MIFNYLFTTLLNYINDKNWKDNIPENLKDFYNQKNYIKAKNYKTERGRISTISGSISFIFTLLVLYFGLFGFISDYAQTLSDSVYFQSFLFKYETDRAQINLALIFLFFQFLSFLFSSI